MYKNMVYSYVNCPSEKKKLIMIDFNDFNEFNLLIPADSSQ